MPHTQPSADFFRKRLSAADIAALPQRQRALYEARPAWSVVASVAAVVGGSLGCLGLLLRKRRAVAALLISVVAVIAQDIGIFGIAGAASLSNPVPLVLQSLLLVIALALVVLARRASARSWLA